MQDEPAPPPRPGAAGDPGRCPTRAKGVAGHLQHAPRTASRLTLAEAALIMREAVKDKSYQLYPLGADAAAYLRAKRKRLTDSSYRDYESCLDKLARHFADLELEQFEPPIG